MAKGYKRKSELLSGVDVKLTSTGKQTLKSLRAPLKEKSLDGLAAVSSIKSAVNKSISESDSCEVVVPKKRGRKPKRKSEASVTVESIAPICVIEDLTPPCSTAGDSAASDSSVLAEPVPLMQCRQDDTSIKSIFDNYIEESHYAKYRKSNSGGGYRTAKKNRTEDDSSSRVAMVKRIEQAIAEGVDEIASFEFFDFADPFGPKIVGQAHLEVYLISCASGRVFEKELIFDGYIVCNEKGERDKNVVRRLVRPELRNKATNVFVVLKATVRSLVAQQGRRGGNSRRGTINLAEELPTIERSFYGARCVMKEDVNGVLETKHCNSQIGMVCSDKDSQEDAIQSCSSSPIPFSMSTESWMDEVHNIEQLIANVTQRQHDGQMAGVNFELSDEHCDEDWAEIGQYRREMTARRSVPRGAESTAFVIADSVRSRTATPNNENVNPDENGREVDANEKLPRTELSVIPALRCPFSLKDFSRLDDLMRHLATYYARLQFTVVDKGTIAVQLMSSDRGGSVVGVDTAGVVNLKKRKVEKISAGIINDHELAVKMPRVVPVGSDDPLYKEGRPYVRSVHNCQWYSQTNSRSIDDFLDCTAEEKRFMKNWNEITWQVGGSCTSQSLVLKALDLFISRHITDASSPSEAEETRLSLTFLLAELFRNKNITADQSALIMDRLYP